MTEETIEVSHPMPSLGSARTIEQALGDLAGIVHLALDLLLEKHSEESCELWGMLLFAGFQQWQNSGFAQLEAQFVAETWREKILDRFGDDYINL